MSASLHVTLRDRPVPDDVMALCRREALRLEALHPSITALWVSLGTSGPPPPVGVAAEVGAEPPRWKVHLAVAVPGHEVIVHHEPSSDERGESIGRTLRDACERARRRLDRHETRHGERRGRRRGGAR